MNVDPLAAFWVGVAVGNTFATIVLVSAILFARKLRKK